MRPSVQVGDDPAVEAPWALLFHGADTSKQAILKGVWMDDPTSVSLRCRFTPDEVKSLVGEVDADRRVLGVQQWFSDERVLQILFQDSRPQPAHCVVFPSGDGAWTWENGLPAPLPFAEVWTSEPFNPFRLARLFGELQIRGKEGPVVAALRLLFPELASLFVASRSNQVLLFAALTSGLRVPLSLLGEGMTRLAIILIAGLSQLGGVWVVDEIENGIHYSVLPKVWRVILDTAVSQNRQVFCTTHSREAVMAAFEVGGEDVRYFRIDARKDGHHAVDYDREHAETTVEMGMDIR